MIDTFGHYRLVHGLLKSSINLLDTNNFCCTTVLILSLLWGFCYPCCFIDFCITVSYKWIICHHCSLFFLPQSFGVLRWFCRTPKTLIVVVEGGKGSEKQGEGYFSGHVGLTGQLPCMKSWIIFVYNCEVL